MRKSSEIGKEELIGMSARIVASTDPGLRGLEGRVADETQRTLTLDTPRGARRVGKSTSTFALARAGERDVEVRGADLVGRPDERIKRKVRT